MKFSFLAILEIFISHCLLQNCDCKTRCTFYSRNNLRLLSNDQVGMALWKLLNLTAA